MLELIRESFKSKSLSNDLLRIYLGMALMLKGIYFIVHVKDIFSMVSYHFPFIDFIFAHFIVLAHIGGGVCLILGFFTRVGALINIPVLSAAIFFVQQKNGVFNTGSEFELVVMVLVLLIYFIWNGSGVLSVDTYVHRSHEERERLDRIQREENRH